MCTLVGKVVIGKKGDGRIPSWINWKIITIMTTCWMPFAKAASPNFFLPNSWLMLIPHPELLWGYGRRKERALIETVSC